jgi:hypothetical protein
MEEIDANRLVEAIVSHPNFIIRYSKQDDRISEDKEEYEKKQHYSQVIHSLLSKDPSLFLERYHHLIQDDPILVKLFTDNQTFMNDEDVKYYIDLYLPKRQVENSDNELVSKQVKNRRYLAMQELMKNTDYFSMENMRLRDPALYKSLIGDNPRFNRDMPIYERILYDSDLHDATVAQKEQHNEDDIDDNSSDEEEQDNVDDPMEQEEDEEQLQTEFLELMQQRFLRGQDDYDYSSIDRDTSNTMYYDQINERDIEDAYFEN